MADYKGKEEEALREEALRLKAEGWQLLRSGHIQGGDYLTAAYDKLAAAEERFRSLGDVEGLIGTLSGLGVCLRATGTKENIVRALEHYREELHLLESENRLQEACLYSSNVSVCLRDLAMVDETVALMHIMEGLEFTSEYLEMSVENKVPKATASGYSNLADLTVLLAEHEPDPQHREEHLKMAGSLYGQAISAWEGLDEEGQVLASMGLAQVYIDMGSNLAGAEDLLFDALEFYRGYEGGEIKYQVAQVHSLLAALMARDGREEESARHQETAVRIFEELGFAAPSSGQGKEEED